MKFDFEIRAISLTYILLFAGLLSQAEVIAQNFWEPRDGLFSGRSVNAIAINASGVIFAGTDGGGVFRSTNNGGNWSTVNNGLTDLFINTLVINGNGDIFAGTGSGVLRSTNNGASWSNILPGFSVESLVVNSSGHIFAGMIVDGIFRSKDNGNSWIAINNGLMADVVNTFAINSFGHIFAGSDEYGVFGSTDNGDNWVALTHKKLSQHDVRSLAVNSNDDIFVGFSGGEIFRSTNNGDSWIEVSTGLSNSRVEALAINSNNVIFAGTFSEGVFRSTDNGNSWVQLNSGLTDLLIRSFVIDENGFIFVGTSDGVFRSIDSTEEPFTRITTGDIVNDGGTSGSWADYDNDGYVDLYVSGGKLYRNNRDGTFTKIITGPISADAGDSGTWGDYDNDGDLDIFIVNHGNNYLYSNNGDGSFTKITAGAIVNDGGRSESCSWGDYDNDGHLDLFVANGGNVAGENNFLYRNNGNGTFTKITAGVIVNDGGPSEGCSWGDLDNDGDLDLFVANDNFDDGEENFLYFNNGNGTFTKVTSGEIVKKSLESKGVSLSDFNRDGYLDLFLTNWNYRENYLFTNNQNGTFTRLTTGPVVSGLLEESIGSTWGDYDNDGDLDLFVSDWDQSNFLYANNGDGTFTEITSSVVVTEAMTSFGCAWADFDNDGDLDLFVANFPNNSLFLNNGSNNNWINIKCEGTISNRSAIGAKVRVKANISNNEVWQMEEISGRTGAGSQNSLNAEFGLGDATTVDEIRIEWPSGVVQVLNNVSANQFLTIVETSQTSLEAPSNLVALANGASVNLTWTDNSNNEAGFKIERKTGVGGTWAEIATTGIDITSYTDTGLATNITYYYRVRAYDGTSFSEYSNDYYALTLATPTRLTATVVSGSQIELTWRDNSIGETGFKIERRTTGNWNEVADVGDGITSYQDTDLIAGTTYSYRMRAYANSTTSTPHYSAYSNQDDATTLQFPDLIVESVSGPNNAVPGQTVSVTVSARNQGGPITQGNHVVLRMILSDNQQINLGDPRYQDVQVPNGEWTGGKTVTKTYSYTIPDGLSGTYYWGAYVDAGIFHTESDENNNALAGNSVQIQSLSNITVTSPNGGESWDVGNQYDITWTSNSVTEVKIEFSTDNSSSWLPVASNILASLSSYTWLVPDESSDKCLVKISDASDNNIFDVSDATFRIIPNVTVVITHGFIPGILNQDWKNYRWQFSMADAISPDRQICLVRRGIVYRSSLDYADFAQISGSRNIDVVVSDFFTTALNLNPNEDVVFVVDWVQESDHHVHGYSEAIADVIFAALVKTAQKYPWLLDELHFIGHSRGTVVNSEIIQRLIFAATNSQNFMPPGVTIDKNIHMTTLDPHPVGHWIPAPINDDAVNSSNITVFENGKYKRIGVVGWKNGDYRVSFIDNYFQDEFVIRGLSDFPGLNSTGLFSNIDLTQIIDDFNPHILVHTWYYGTVDTVHAKEAFGHGKNIIRGNGNWYIDGKGALQGFYYSLQRDGSLDVIESIDDNLYDVNSDLNYGEGYLVFNGDFSKNPGVTTNRFPGWDYQGGGGAGVIKSSNGGGMNDHLELTPRFTSKKHNYFFIPNNVSRLYYRLRVKGRLGFDDELIVRIGNIADTYSLRNEYNYKRFSTNISPIRGTYQTLEFEIDGHGLVTSEVWIDEITFYPERYLSFIVASPVALHAYDSLGNHTGPTSDTTWAEDIVGSRYLAESDTLPHPRQIIILPEAPQDIEYRIEIISDNTTGSFDLEIQDVTDSVQTVTTFFDSVVIEPNTVATGTLKNVTPQFNLQVDLDGDGTFEATVEPALYLQNFTIVARAELNGSINPRDTTIVNYGDSLTFIITPDNGYSVADVLVDNVSIGPAASYTFTNITEDHALSATFSQITGIIEEQSIPNEFYLSQNYPNPFNPETIIEYQTPRNAAVTIRILNLTGQEIVTLVNEEKAAGRFKTIWDGKDLFGKPVATGIYVYQMRAGDFVQSMKLVLIR